ncbi:MAG TPA: PH domain-containing protein [Burkholderiales bacterium]|nr:PH domain-containing protein [Burkholderiales bacterium]
MSSYVDGVLINGESVMYRARISLWSLWLPILVGLATLPLFGLGLVFWLWAWIVYATTELAITNKRVIAKSGLVSRSTIEMFLEKIESIQVEQGVLGRMFNFGSVVISGTGVHSAPFRNISDPLALRKNFMAAADARHAA